MVPVEVGIDHVADRLGGELLADLRGQRRHGRRLGMGIHNQNVGCILEYHSITIEQRLRFRQGRVYSLGHLLEIEENGLRRRPGLRTGLRRPEDRLLDQRSGGPACAERPRQKSAAGMYVHSHLRSHT